MAAAEGAWMRLTAAEGRPALAGGAGLMHALVAAADMKTVEAQTGCAWQQQSSI